MDADEFELLGEPRMTMAQFWIEEQLAEQEEEMSEHTSGDWKVGEQRKDGYGIFAGEVGTPILNGKVKELPDALLMAFAPKMYDELDMIVEAWELIDVGKVYGRELTPFEKERLNFARDLLDRIDDK